MKVSKLFKVTQLVACWSWGLKASNLALVCSYAERALTTLERGRLVPCQADQEALIESTAGYVKGTKC